MTMRRMMVALATTCLATVGVVGLAGSPAVAEVTPHFAYTANGCGATCNDMVVSVAGEGIVGEAWVKTNGADPQTYTVTVFDYNCGDGIATEWRAHKKTPAGAQFDYTDSHCGSNSTGTKYTVPRTSLATTSVNWWVEFGTNPVHNSPAENFQ